MSDPREASARDAAVRLPRSARIVGWCVGVVLWAVASDGHVLLAVASALVAIAIRCVYVVVGWGKGRFVFRSAWLFAVAAICELVWRFG
jgi:Flp pilus assembly protein TadB